MARLARFVLGALVLGLPVGAVRRIPRAGRPARDLASEIIYGDPAHQPVDPKSADDHLITSLPGLKGFKPRHWSGMLTVDEANSGRLFYYFVEAEEDPQTKPLLIWLNGGPGCSSMDGFFLENGPFKVQDDLTLSLNPYSWHKAANVLYIDQPVGTGWSYVRNGKYCNDDDCINKHFESFLQSFFKLHSWLLLEDDKQKTRPVFFSGESQAGHYIPSMVAHILKLNKGSARRNTFSMFGDKGGIFGASVEEVRAQEAEAAATYQRLLIDVKGMAIGNGWMDPPSQYDVSAMAHAVGVITEEQYRTLQVVRRECVTQLDRGVLDSDVCYRLLDDVIAASSSRGGKALSVYDYSLYDGPGDRVYPQGHKNVELYMNQRAVKEAMHALESPLDFQECTDPPYDHLKHQDGKGVLTEVAEVLESKAVRVLFFNGAKDLICNHLGNEAAIRRVQWSGRKSFESARNSVWVPAGQKEPAGYVKQAGSLAYLVVMNAGHMVPLSVPGPALDMITRFVQGTSLGDNEQAIVATPERRKSRGLKQGRAD